MEVIVLKSLLIASVLLAAHPASSQEAAIGFKITEAAYCAADSPEERYACAKWLPRIIVTSVACNSPAHAAGLRPADFIRIINGRHVVALKYGMIWGVISEAMRSGHLDLYVSRDAPPDYGGSVSFDLKKFERCEGDFAPQ
jgi:hypothetical protein